MANLTLSIDDKLLQAARVRAVKERTSVNEVCRQALEAYVRPSGQQRLQHYLRVQAEIDAAVRTSPAVSTPWKSREEMYEEVLDQRHPTLSGAKKKTAKSSP
jgi:plasmid stability protein